MFRIIFLLLFMKLGRGPESPRPNIKRCVILVNDKGEVRDICPDEKGG